MKTVYEAANALEAHMLADVLKQEGITAQVLGGFLTGAVGQLPAAGLVRLEVEEEDFERARAVITHWESTQVNDLPPGSVDASTQRAWLWGLGGLLFGAGLCWAWLHVPVNQNGFDHNHDGRVDERWEYSAANIATSGEVDRNFDGRMDLRYRYDAQGALASADGDDNFDGVFETHTRFRANQPQTVETDADLEGVLDTREHYNALGQITRTERLAPPN